MKEPDVLIPTKLNTDQVNHLNSALMVGSCVAAYLVPIELFLFSYAVLGPLHYLTEISWLHDRKYFTSRRWDGAILVAVCIVAAVLNLTTLLELSDAITREMRAAMTAVALGGAIVLTQASAPVARVAALAVVVVLIALTASAPSFYALFAIFLPTIVHVLLFTAAFVLLGALRHRSVSGAGSLGVLVVCAVSFFVWAPPITPSMPTAYVLDSYRSFAPLNLYMLGLLGHGELEGAAQVLGSDIGLRVMRLIAFAYTYHYLNWFSKTSIIRWHEVPRSRFVAVLVFWVASLAIYAWDYRTGLIVLFALSLAHVYLEFPLNVQSFVGIGQELRTLARGMAPVPAAAGAGSSRAARRAAARRR